MTGLRGEEGPRRVAVVGSRSFPIDAEVGAEIVDLLKSYPDGTVYLTRGSPGFDRFVMKAAEIIGRTAIAFPGKGGADNFTRDIELVSQADEVLVFFDPDTLHDTTSGTSHVLEVSLNQNKPVRAFSAVASSLVFAGETGA